MSCFKKVCFKFDIYYMIGERSEPPSDKLGGETFFISSGALVCLSLHIWCRMA